MGRTGLVVCAVAGLAWAASGQEFIPIERHATVDPIRVAQAVSLPDGSVVRVSEWTAYEGGQTRADRQIVFDLFTREGSCGIQNWRYRGEDYCNMYVTNDMTVGANADLSRGLDKISHAWYWSCGELDQEACVIGIFTQDSVPCEENSFDYIGWLLDYGTLSCNTGGYYLSEIELSADAWPMPTGGTGSYRYVYARGLTDQGEFELATCAQPILFATGEDRGDPDSPGTQGPFQFDDLNADGVHTPDECVDYSTPVCPYEFGPVAAWWQFIECDRADINGDGVIDTRDVVAFLTAWGAQDPASDCDGSGAVDTQDFTCFLNAWTPCV